MKKHKFYILSVEDNEPDFVVLKKALEDNCSDLILEFMHIKDGATAIDFLFKRGEYEKAKTPDIVILDLNLVDMNGLDVLSAIKESNEIKHIPVIMFTTSESETDINRAYQLYANSYITKTFTPEDMFKKIGIIGDYWLKTTEIPESGLCIMKMEENKNG